MISNKVKYYLNIAQTVKYVQDGWLKYHPKSKYVLEDQDIYLKLTLWPNDFQVKTSVSRVTGGLTSQLSNNGNQHEVSRRLEALVWC